MLEIHLTKEDVPLLQISSVLPFARYVVNDRCLTRANSMAAHGVNHEWRRLAQIAGGAEVAERRRAVGAAAGPVGD